MKLYSTYTRTIIAVVMAFGIYGMSSNHAKGHQLEWASEIFSSIVDSHGNTLNPINFVFELGSFDVGFDAGQVDVQYWRDYWNVFDTADYDQDLGYFTSSIEPYNGGQDVFEDMGIERTAYIWIRNADVPSPVTEWLIMRASDWVFPDIFTGCCDNEETIQWSISDLGEFDVPLWGNQGGVEGPGIRNTDGTDYTLQTYTFIPEPSTTLLVALAGLLGVTRRSRQSKATHAIS